MSLWVLHEVQRALEQVYRLEPGHDVRDFMIPEETRAGLRLSRAPQEQLLLRQEEDALEVGLFIDPSALAGLERGLDDDNLPQFLLAVEGVSHFLYVMVRAQSQRRFSALELELQAEVDKFLLALLIAWAAHRQPPSGEELRRRLFTNVRLHDDLSDEERSRYATANQAADEYAASLDARFVRRRALSDMLAETRRFYRLGCAEKLDHIARKAA